MPKQEGKPTQRTTRPRLRHHPNREVKQQSMQEAVRDFLASAQACSKVVACIKCGSTSNLQKITASLCGNWDEWEISLPLCQSCASQERSNSSCSTDGFDAAGRNRASMRVGAPSKFGPESLVSEINSIHTDNEMYWRRGQAATLTAKAEYHRRQERLEEIRTVLTKLPVA